MSLLAVQSFLARLYTDSAFRARFFAAPEEAGAGMGLTAEEQRQLLALDPQQVERFARSLRQKRLTAVRELLPGTARLMGDRFVEAFFLYCEGQPSALERSDEARAFGECLLKYTREPDPRLPGCFTDLLVCERLCLEVLYPPTTSPGVEITVCSDETTIPCAVQPAESSEGEPGSSSPSEASACSAANLLDALPRLTSRAHVAAFQYDLAVLYPLVLRGEAGAASPDPCFILIGKVRGGRRARLKRLNAATARLLILCDGTRRLSAIIAEVAAALRLGPAECRAFGSECARFLAPLVEVELIELSAAE